MNEKGLNLKEIQTVASLINKMNKTQLLQTVCFIGNFIEDNKTYKQTVESIQRNEQYKELLKED